MSISRILEPRFVRCIDCVYRRKRKDLRRRPSVFYYCELHQHRLYGQKGCCDGSRRRLP